MQLIFQIKIRAAEPSTLLPPSIVKLLQEQLFSQPNAIYLKAFYRMKNKINWKVVDSRIFSPLKTFL